MSLTIAILLLLAALLFALGAGVSLYVAMLWLRALPELLLDIRSALRPPHGPSGPIR